MIKFKLDNDVKVLSNPRNYPGIEKGNTGVVIATSWWAESHKPTQITVFFGLNLNYGFYEEELELLPKLKTLAQLWEESDKERFKASDSSSQVVEFLTVFKDEDGRMAALFIENSCAYKAHNADQPIWQLYQEPAEPEDNWAEASENMVNNDIRQIRQNCKHSFEVSDGMTVSCSLCGHLMTQKDAENLQKSAEKCEHENTLFNEVDGYYCKDCGVDLEEKWLWWWNDSGIYRITTGAQTEQEAKANFGQRIIKKATWSRDLFEVGKNEGK